jgi:hypothetical protein
MWRNPAFLDLFGDAFIKNQGPPKPEKQNNLPGSHRNFVQISVTIQ